MSAHPSHVCPSDIPVVVLDATQAWSNLSEREKKYAHHFGKACWAGMQIVASQVSPEASKLLELIYHLFKDGFAFCDGDEHATALIDYCCFCVSNLGNYKCIGDSKIVPALLEQEFSSLVARRGDPDASKAWELVRGAVYSLDAEVLQFGFPPEHISQYCIGGATKEDAELANRFLAQKGQEAWNTRLERRRDGSLFIWRASVEASTIESEMIEGQHVTFASGDHSAHLQRVAHHLRLAADYCANERQTKMLEYLQLHFKTGELQLHKEASKEWVLDSTPTIETTIGFIESDRDPAGVRSEFEGFVAIVNKEVSEKFGVLVSRAQELLKRLPWSSEFEKDTFIKPEFTSLDVVAFCSGSLPLGICLPNYDDIRTNVGFKNVDLGNVCTARSKDSYAQYLSAADASLFQRKYAQADQVLTGLHELIGHGSGKLFQQGEDGVANYEVGTIHPCRGEPVSSCYKPGQTYGTVFGSLASPMEECRAECVSMYLGVDEDIQNIFGFKDEAAEESIYVGWLGMCWLGLKALEYFDPGKGVWGAVHGRARYAIFRHLLGVSDSAGKRLLTYEILEHSEPKDVILSMDRDLIRTVGRPAIGKLLLEIHVARCTADPSLAKTFEELTDVPSEFLTLREIILGRKRPRDIFVQPTTVLSDDGDVRLKSYPASTIGVLQGFVDRFEPLQSS